jgi:prepilin-type N-terminal cleavage/methylation domain-containing protein
MTFQQRHLMGPQQQWQDSGFTLIELLVVVTILGILAVVGVNMIGNRRAAAVRSLMDEIEGALNNARQAATATGKDQSVVSWGNWTAATPLVLAYGNGTLAPGAIQTDANNQLAGTVTAGSSVVVGFHYLPQDAIHSRARLVLSGSTDWATAMTATGSGAKNTNITGLDPFLAGDPMNTLSGDVGAGTPTLTGALTACDTISGSSQRFMNSMIIEIVGTSPDNGPIPGGPMGLLVVLANGSTVYKFYNPGVLEGNGQWRKL